MKTMSIGQLSAATGVNIETIRYYEREGVLPQAMRTESGRRIYDNGDVRQLSFVNKSRNLGFSLKEIQNLMGLVDSGRYTCKEINELTTTHLDQVKRKIGELHRMERALKEMVSECSKGKIPHCPIIDRLLDNAD